MRPKEDAGGNGPQAPRRDAVKAAAFGGAIGGGVAGALVILAADADIVSEALTNVVRGALLILICMVLGALVAALWTWLTTSAVSISGREDRDPIGVTATSFTLLALAALLGSGMSSGAFASLWLHLAIVASASALTLVASRCSGEAAAGWPGSLGPAVLIGAWALTLGLRLAASGRLPGGALVTVFAVGASAAAGYVAYLVFERIRRSVADSSASSKAAVVVPGVLLLLLTGLATAGIVSEVQGWRVWEKKLQTVMDLGEGQGNPPPNVILISVDTLRADYVGYAGGDVRTPHLDRLAEKSYVFENAFSVAPWTRPSFAAFFGGRYPSQMGVGRIRGQMASDHEAVPYTWDAEQRRPLEALRDAGYFNGAVVVNPHLSVAANADKGFDFYYHTELDYVRPHNALSVVKRIDETFLPFLNLTTSRFELERAPTMTNYTLGLLEHLTNQPALLWVHYVDPHYPYDPPTIAEDQRITGDPMPLQALKRAQTITTREKYRDAYAREVDYWDTWFGRTVDRLKANGLWDNSIVVFWSDHGEEFWEHGHWGHGQSLHSELTHVPLLVHLPGQTEQVRISRHVSLLDVMPTLMDLCEVEHPEGMEGRSLVPLFEGKPDALEPLHMYMEACGHGGVRKALLGERYKLTYDLDADRYSLYDLKNDPAEHHDIFGTAAAPDTSTMKADLADWTELSFAIMEETAGGSSAESLPPEIRQRLRDMGYIQ